MGNPNLFGTETLCGDWDGDLLIVAQDFAPARFIEERIADLHPNPYSHDPALETNRMLVKLLNENGRSLSVNGDNNLQCGALYISACFLLRDDGKFSGTPPNWCRASSGAKEVFSFTLSRMPNLRKIACLGALSFAMLAEMADVTKDWRQALNEGTPINYRGLPVYAHSHTGRLGQNYRLPRASKDERLNAIRQDWSRMMRVRA